MKGRTSPASASKLVSIWRVGLSSTTYLYPTSRYASKKIDRNLSAERCVYVLQDYALKTFFIAISTLSISDSVTTQMEVHVARSPP